MTSTKPKRRPELDALRGLFLVLMVMAHLPTQLSDWANQPIGFISAAEGFVGLSAMLVGRIYFGKLAKDEAGVRTKLWKRSLRIYCYHLILLALLFTVAAGFAVHTDRTAILNLLTYYLAHPVEGLISSVLLIYCPPLFDILPMYILFLFFTPLILSAAKRVGWRWVLAISAAVWLTAQFGVREVVHHWMAQFLNLHVPLQATGAFNLFAWQLVWIMGLWFGAASATDGLPLNKLPRWAFPAAVAVCCFFLGIRHGWLGPHLGQQSFGAELDKWQLGPLRVLNIAACIVVFWQLRKYIAKALTHEPLITFGQASIEVFCAHLFFVFVGLSLIAGDRLHTHGTTAIMLDIVTFPALFGIAVVVVRRQRAKRVPRAQGPAPPRGAPALREERQMPLLAREPDVVTVRDE